MITGTLVPFPIESADKTCKGIMLRAVPAGAMLLIEAQGFTPGEKLKFTSNSEGEKIENTPAAEADGRFFTALLPYVKGKEKGTIDVTLEAAACKLSWKAAWGPDSDRPL